jgi:hypothetical protein
MLLVVVLASGCPGPGSRDAGSGGGGGAPTGGGAAGGGVTGGGVTGGGATGGGGGASDGGVEGVELFGKLAGLWSGPATMTPLGNFPVMNFDLRPVDGQFVFGQSDLDAANTLRFGFSIETYGDRDVLAYRNGGFFQGVLRDSRTALVETDGGTYRFCFVGDAGCGYIDARFTVAGAQLTLDTKVRGNQHVLWNATRDETRTVPTPFPSDTASRGDGGAPWPAMASVQVTANFGLTLAAPANVWVLLTTTPCFPTFGCRASRAVMTSAALGDSSATLTVPTVHAGAYKATVLLDLDRNFATARAPNTGDRIAVDQDLTVPASGTANLTATTSFAVP